MTDQRASASRRLVPVLVLIGMVTAVVSSLGAPLLATIARVDHVTLGDAQWSLTITMVVGAITAPVLGRLGDGPYRRTVVFVALGGIVLGSGLAALPVGGFALLLIGRGLQGIGLGLMPLTMAVARDSLPHDRSARAISILSISTAAGAGLGYPITGVLDDTLGLHATFWFGAIAGAVAIVASWNHIPSSGHLEGRPLDVSGSVLLGAGLVALLIGVTEGQPWGWGSGSIVGLLIGAAVVLSAWVVRELKARHPLVDLRLLRHLSLTVTNLAALLIAIAMYIYIPLFTDFMQTPRSAGYGLGASIVVTGLMLVPFSILSTTMSRAAALLGARIGQERIVPIGAAVTAVAVGLQAFPARSLWEGFLDMGIAGIGIGFSFAAMPGLIVRSVPPEETGSALGFYQVVRFAGFSLGSGIAATVLAAYTKAGQQLPARAGYTAAFVVGAGFCLAAAAIGAWLSRPKAAPARAPWMWSSPVRRWRRRSNDCAESGSAGAVRIDGTGPAPAQHPRVARFVHIGGGARVGDHDYRLDRADRLDVVAGHGLVPERVAGADDAEAGGGVGAQVGLGGRAAVAWRCRGRCRGHCRGRRGRAVRWGRMGGRMNRGAWRRGRHWVRDRRPPMLRPQESDQRRLLVVRGRLHRARRSVSTCGPDVGARRDPRMALYRSHGDKAHAGQRRCGQARADARRPSGAAARPHALCKCAHSDRAPYATPSARVAFGAPTCAWIKRFSTLDSRRPAGASRTIGWQPPLAQRPSDHHVTAQLQLGRQSSLQFGSPADPEGPVALRVRLTTDLPFR